MTGPVHTARYGSGDGSQPSSCGVGASQQLFSGEIALVSGSGAVTAGYLKNAATAGSSDIVAGMLGEPAGGTGVFTGSSITAPASDGVLQMEVLTGTFMIQSGTGSDLLGAATNYKTVYYGGENANGPIACATNGGVNRPILGIQLPQDPGIAGGFAPGSNYWPITINPALGKP
jgi:hypothetical protein